MNKTLVTILISFVVLVGAVAIFLFGVPHKANDSSVFKDAEASLNLETDVITFKDGSTINSGDIEFDPQFRDAIYNNFEALSQSAQENLKIEDPKDICILWGYPLNDDRFVNYICLKDEAFKDVSKTNKQFSSGLVGLIKTNKKCSCK